MTTNDKIACKFIKIHLVKSKFRLVGNDFSEISVFAISPRILRSRITICKFNEMLYSNDVAIPAVEVQVKIVWCSPLFQIKYKTYVVLSATKP